MLIVTSAVAKASPEFCGPQNEVLVQNIFTAVAFVPKPLVYFGEEGKLAVFGIDGACDWVVMGLQMPEAHGG
jgi:hypothetical protein